METRAAELEKELLLTKQTLRGTIEELVTANEELRSANEEYQSTDEEAQSMNEELETSREELQSVNEELMTMNTQYQSKLDEMLGINDDMANVFNSTEIATIFLDSGLNVKRFTPAATTLFNLIDSDVGRPLDHLSSKLMDQNISAKARRMLDTLTPVRETVRARGGKTYLMRMHPYRTRDDRIAGAVLSFIDLTELGEVRESVKYSQFLEEVAGTVRQPLVVLDQQLRVVFANAAFFSKFGLAVDSAEGRMLSELGKSEFGDRKLMHALEGLFDGTPFIEGFVLEAESPDKQKRKLVLNMRRLQGASPDGRALVAIEDITQNSTPGN
jgi:two-component system CheB/CheR fusion protein